MTDDAIASGIDAVIYQEKITAGIIILLSQNKDVYFSGKGSTPQMLYSITLAICQLAVIAECEPEELFEAIGEILPVAWKDQRQNLGKIMEG